MKIFNIMMSRGLGGIQQAYLDYGEALASQNHEVINISSYKALINTKLAPSHMLFNLANWCFLSSFYLAFLIKKHQPDIIICHGNRAINFAVKSNYLSQAKIIGVSHNYSYKKLKKCDSIITLTEDLKQNLLDNGVEESKLLPLPNMIRICHDYKESKYRKPITIGSIGRFVKKKGFACLIEAINLIKKSGYEIKLLIGGDGEEKQNLMRISSELNLQDNIDFVGWVDNQDVFFDQIDLFCLPSISEPFGIILLEAMEQSIPVVATKSGGPEEIIRHEEDGFLANVNSAEDLAKYLILLISNQTLANKMSKSAYDRVKEKYDINIVAKTLSEIIKKVN